MTCKFTNNQFNIGDTVFIKSGTQNNGIVGSGIVSTHITKERLLLKRAHFHTHEEALAWNC